MVYNAHDASNLSRVIDTYNMFAGALSFNGNFSSWDVSSVTDMSLMFGKSEFNGDISGWDVSGVVSMSGMFAGAPRSVEDPSGSHVWGSKSMRYYLSQSKPRCNSLYNLSLWGLKYSMRNLRVSSFIFSL